MSRSRARLTCLLVTLMAAGGMVPVHAYLKLGTDVNGRTISLKWSGRATAVRYFISDAGVSGVSAPQFRDAVTRGFTTWQDVETSSVGFEFGGFVSARPLDQDDANVIGFANRPDLERTLASTSFLIDTRSGEILESDIFFNSNFQWSVATSGEPGRFDVQSIATHEAGHFLGLGHSSLGETEVIPTGGRRLISAASVMFPIAYSSGNIIDRELQSVHRPAGRRLLARPGRRLRHRRAVARPLRRADRAAGRRRSREFLRKHRQRRRRLPRDVLWSRLRAVQRQCVAGTAPRHRVGRTRGREQLRRPQ